MGSTEEYQGLHGGDEVAVKGGSGLSVDERLFEVITTAHEQQNYPTYALDNHPSKGMPDKDERPLALVRLHSGIVQRGKHVFTKSEQALCGLGL